jgi:hypothetical protein
VTLAPNAVTPAAFDLNMAALDAGFTLSDDFINEARLAFCVLPDDRDVCPDVQQYPHLHGELPPLPLRAAHPTISATRPTAATMPAWRWPPMAACLPATRRSSTRRPGCRKARCTATPRPFHLGKRVSLEAEADIGPDQDPLNNIVPLAADPDNDRGDDGTNLAQWNLNGCADDKPARAGLHQPGGGGLLPATGDARLSQRLARQQPRRRLGGYDPMRPGSRRSSTSPSTQPVNVVSARCAGLHTVNVPTGLTPPGRRQSAGVGAHHAERTPVEQDADGRRAELRRRARLSQPLQAPARPRITCTGRRVPTGAGPDLEVAMTARTERRVAHDALAQGATADQLGNFEEVSYFRIEYSNLGATDSAERTAGVPDTGKAARLPRSSCGVDRRCRVRASRSTSKRSR